MAPCRVFLIVGFVFGTLMTLIVPPFQAPDEHRDFWRIYQVSEGQLAPTWHDNTGIGVLPISLARVIEPFAAVRFNQSITSFGAIMTALRMPLRPEQRITYLLGNASSYSPLVFLPQAIAVAIGRALGATPLAMMYLGRLGNIWLWVALGYAALKIAPQFGWPLMLLMLMPMSLFQAASLSPDAITNALAFLVVALIFQAILQADENSRIGWRWLAAFVISSAALSLTKAAYFPLAGLIFLIPSRRFGGRAHFALAAIVAILAAAIPLLIWSARTPGLDMVTYLGAPYVSAHSQCQFLLSHPAMLLKIPLLSAQRDRLLVVQSFVGRLGWLNIQLPSALVVCYLAALILACRAGADQRPYGSLRRLAAVIAAVVALSAAWRSSPARPRSPRANRRLGIMTTPVALLSCLYTLVLLYLHYYVSVAVGRV
jgi:Predicted membrane protein (DUF2142)